MVDKELKQLSLLLDKYYRKKAEKCDYDCYNCELGVYESYYDSSSCAIEVVSRAIDNELYP